MFNYWKIIHKSTKCNFYFQQKLKGPPELSKESSKLKQNKKIDKQSLRTANER